MAHGRLGPSLWVIFLQLSVLQLYRISCLHFLNFSDLDLNLAVTFDFLATKLLYQLYVLQQTFSTKLMFFVNFCS